MQKNTSIIDKKSTEKLELDMLNAEMLQPIDDPQGSGSVDDLEGFVFCGG